MYRVYVVDDDELILEEMIQTVPWMDNGYEVVGFSTHPARALDEIEALCPDVVFCDLKMPCMDGNELISKVRTRCPDLEFIMLSAYGTFEDSRTFFLQKGFDYILKPLQQEEIQIVLERLSARLSERKGEFLPAEMEGVNPAFAALISYITENFHKKFTLEALGRQFNLSPNYICNLFAKHYQSTLTRFLTRLRMQEALRQMTDSRKAFKEIAVDCGYTDYFYFCKVFRETYGMSPTQYQKNGG